MLKQQYYYVKVMRNTTKDLWDVLPERSKELLVKTTLSKKAYLGYIGSKPYHENELVLVPFGQEQFIGIVEKPMDLEDVREDVNYKEILANIGGSISL
jgi:hypothetical protein